MREEGETEIQEVCRETFGYSFKCFTKRHFRTLRTPISTEDLVVLEPHPKWLPKPGVLAGCRLGVPAFPSTEHFVTPANPESSAALRVL